MKRMQNKLNNIDENGGNGSGGNRPYNSGDNDDSGNGQKETEYGDNGSSNKSGGGN